MRRPSSHFVQWMKCNFVFRNLDSEKKRKEEKSRVNQESKMVYVFQQFWHDYGNVRYQLAKQYSTTTW